MYAMGKYRDVRSRVDGMRMHVGSRNNVWCRRRHRRCCSTQDQQKDEEEKKTH